MTEREPDQSDFARGQETEYPTTLEEEVEREREGTYSRGQEDLPEETIEKQREGSYARGQEDTPEDTFEKVREGTFAEGQEEYPHEPEVVEGDRELFETDTALDDTYRDLETDRDTPGNVRPRDESRDADTAI
jgi:hypothetical protein